MPDTFMRNEIKHHEVDLFKCRMSCRLHQAGNAAVEPTTVRVSSMKRLLLTTAAVIALGFGGAAFAQSSSSGTTGSGTTSGRTGAGTSTDTSGNTTSSSGTTVSPSTSG